MLFDDSISIPLLFIVDPTKRIFFIYIISSFFLALGVFYLRERNWSKAFNHVFDMRVWSHSSMKVDLSLFLFNAILRSLVFGLIAFSSIGVAEKFMKFLYETFPDYSSPGFNYKVVVFLYSVVSFTLLDFSRFYQHYLFHKIPFLWRFHKTHHSAEVLTPLTLYRTHPIESLISSLRRLVVIGFVSGFFMFLTQSMIGGAYAILGVSAFDFIFNLLGSNLRHSHVWLSFGPLNHVFMSPAQHQIHHSRSIKHRDKNLGFALSLWDKMFGTFYQVKKKEFLIFGVTGVRHKNFFQVLR